MTSRKPLIHPVLFCLVFSCVVLSCVVLSCHFLSSLVLSCLVLSHPVLFCLVFTCLVLSSLVLSCHFLSSLVLSCLVLSRPVLSCLVLASSERVAMDVVDVASLHGAVQAWDRWMGCILSPDPAGIEEKVNLLEKGEKVQWKTTMHLQILRASWLPVPPHIHNHGSCASHRF